MTITNNKGEASLSWRQEGIDNVPSTGKQHGINPSRFYKDDKASSSDNHGSVTAGRRRQRQHLQVVLSQAQANVLVEKRREVSSELALKRSAFKAVTSLRHWPLQDLAMNDLDKLLLNEKESTASCRGTTTTTTLSHGMVASYSSSSSSSGCSILEEEPKRTKANVENEKEPLSPRKSTLRNQFRLVFLKEQIIPFIAKHKRSTDEENGVAVGEEKEEANASRGDKDQNDDTKEEAADSINDDQVQTDERNQEANNNHDDADQTNLDQRQKDRVAPGVDNEMESDFLPALWCMEPRIFAVENTSGGRRRYIVGHLGRFLDRYWRKSDAKHRHYYELIRQGDPCRLYFDLEFHKAANPEITESVGEELMDELYQEVRSEFQRVYEIDNVDRSCIVDLDSSTETKFSRHWIVHLPNKALFEDASAVGRFVKNLVGRLASDTATNILYETRPTLAKHLFVNAAKKKQNQHDGNSSSDRDQTTCFIDLGVYTRNRLFRLLGSSKFGKPASAALRVASSNKFPFPSDFCNECFYVPDVERKSKEATNDENNQSASKEAKEDVDMTRFKSSVDWTMHAEALAQTLVVPMNATRIQFPILSSQEGGDDLQQTLSHPNRPKPRKTGLLSASGVEKSPFPLLDDFVLHNLGTRGGVDGAIRVWSLDGSNDQKGSEWEGAQSITYQMCRNRWCERIGRAHKSNNILWTVDLRTMSCVQSCHDPECRMMKFRGTPVPLPQTVCEHVQDVMFEQQLAAMDEAALLRNNNQAGLKNNGQEELDDAEFEQALLNLDISGKKDKPKVEPLETKEQACKEGKELLSDSTLFDAVLTNPELFP